MRVFGRVDEQAALGRLLDGARRGRSATLVLCGEPGIGKSTLLDEAQHAAGDFRVLRVAGYESERDLAFAGVHRLVLPFLERRDRLPPRQRLALESAFGLIDATPTDRFLVGLAVVSLLADAADDRPLLCVVDDAHWLDDESAAALAFAGRRLRAERITLLFGVRDSEWHRLPLEGLPTLQLGGLAEPDAVELLRSVVVGPIDLIAARRVVADTGGSPLALVELAGGLTAEQLAARALTHEPLPVGRRLEAHFLRQVEALPSATRRLLLLIAAEASGDRALVDGAARSLGLVADAAEPAEAAGLLSLRPVMRFRHPLVRAGVYSAAPPAERRAAHEALAEAAGANGDRDRYAWHLGAAASGPDEDVAVELEAAADRALRRGGCAAGAAFYTRAAELSADHRRQVDRAIAAAERHLVAGFRIRARDVLAELAADIDDPLQRAKAARLDGAIRYAVGETDRTVSILLGAAQRLRPYDIHAARDALLQALAAARVTGRFTAPGESEIDVARAAKSMPLPPGAAPTIGDLLLDGDSALFLDGHEAAAPLLRRAVLAIDDDLTDSDEMLRWLGIGSWAAGAIGDHERLLRLATRLEQTAREHGAVVPLSIGLMFLGLAELFDGSLAAARSHLTERAELMEAIGRPTDIGTLVLLAWAGDEDATRAEAAAVVERARQTGHGWMLVFVGYALSVLEVGLGNYAAAFTTASKNYQENPFLSVVAFPDLIEAAMRSGQRTAAADALDTFSSRVLTTPTPLTRGLVAFGRALLADDDHAEALHLESLECLRTTRGTAHRARAHLVYGEWLRRRKRRVDARDQLRTAHELFSAMGAGAFAERARRELAATGERARRRSVDTAGELTPQESQIARLAAEGATNPEIANKLFLSSSTVDYHLRKVYRKLDVPSRRQLPRALTR